MEDRSGTVRRGAPTVVWCKSQQERTFSVTTSAAIGFVPSRCGTGRRVSEMDRAFRSRRQRPTSRAVTATGGPGRPGRPHRYHRSGQERQSQRIACEMRSAIANPELESLTHAVCSRKPGRPSRFWRGPVPGVWGRPDPSGDGQARRVEAGSPRSGVGTTPGTPQEARCSDQELGPATPSPESVGATGGRAAVDLAGRSARLRLRGPRRARRMRPRHGGPRAWPDRGGSAPSSPPTSRRSWPSRSGSGSRAWRCAARTATRRSTASRSRRSSTARGRPRRPRRATS